MFQRVAKVGTDKVFHVTGYFHSAMTNLCRSCEEVAGKFCIHIHHPPNIVQSTILAMRAKESAAAVQRGMTLLGMFYGSYFFVGFVYPIWKGERLTDKLARDAGIEKDPNNCDCQSYYDKENSGSKTT